MMKQLVSVMTRERRKFYIHLKKGLNMYNCVQLRQKDESSREFQAKKFSGSAKVKERIGSEDE